MDTSNTSTFRSNSGSRGWIAAIALLSFLAPTLAYAQTATFAQISDRVPGRCYNPATTAPDPTNPNRLVIGIHTGIVSGTFGTSAGCLASDEGSSMTSDTLLFVATAPPGFRISRITFSQTLSTSGSRGGRGFAAANWVVDDDPQPARSGAAVADLTAFNKTVVPVSISTYLAAAGGTVRSGSATASNPSVLVELSPLVGEPPPPPPPPPANPVPATSAVAPSVVTARGSAFTLTVTGGNFVSGSVVRWNGLNRPTTPVSSSLLRASIGAADIAAPGTAVVTVFNPDTGLVPADGGLSNEQFVTINPAPDPNPLPTTTSLEPSTAMVQTLSLAVTVNGTNFIPGSVVRWNGVNRPTTFVSPTRVTAVLGVADLFVVGTASIAVFNPATGFNPPPDGGLSNAQTFTVTEVPPPPPPVPGPTPVSAHGNVDDRRGKEWRQLTQTVNLTHEQLASVCPEDGATPCVGRIGSVDMTGWVWATSTQLFDLLGYFTTGVSPQTPNVGGVTYGPIVAQFQSLFSLTQHVTGCTTYQGCFDFRAVAGSTASRNEQGQTIGGTVINSVNQFGTFEGSFSVGPVAIDGNGPRGVFMWRPTGLVDGGVYANDDAGQSATPFGGTVFNVMSNDWVGGAPASAGNATAAAISSPSDRITIASDGSVVVSPGALAATHTLDYRLCASGGSGGCSDARVSVVVRSFPLVAVNDQASVSFAAGGSAINVLANDTLNGQVATTAVVSLRQLSSTHAGVSLNLSTGFVVVAAGTPSGTHTLGYEACELANPANCRQATVTLVGRSIVAVNDVFPKISKDGGVSPSVLTNDRYNGAVATTATVQLSLVTAPPPGITLDLATGRFVVADGAESGDYVVTYRICEIGSAVNCASASASLEISGSAN